MQALADILQRHGVDTSTLQSLFGTGEETVYTLSDWGDTVTDLWPTLRSLVAETGYWPVILGDRSDRESHIRSWQHIYAKPLNDILKASHEIDSVAWIENSWENEFDYDEEYSEDVLRGDWPEDVAPRDTISSVVMDLNGNILPQVYMALVPTTQGWQVPAYLKFGEWNACPSPEEHVAIMRYWHEKYGAEPAVITHDTVEMEVARPPTDREEALILAREQFVYCGDLVEQGTGTLDRLAAELLNGTVWLFWWD